MWREEPSVPGWSLMLHDHLHDQLFLFRILGKGSLQPKKSWMLNISYFMSRPFNGAVFFRKLHKHTLGKRWTDVCNIFKNPWHLLSHSSSWSMGMGNCPALCQRYSANSFTGARAKRCFWNKTYFTFNVQPPYNALQVKAHRNFGTLSLILFTSKYFRWKFHLCPSF